MMILGSGYIDRLLITHYDCCLLSSAGLLEEKWQLEGVDIRQRLLRVSSRCELAKGNREGSE